MFDRQTRPRGAGWRRQAGLLVPMLAVIAAGCQPVEPAADWQHAMSSGKPLTAAQVAAVPAEPNIVKVVVMFNPYNSWLWTEDKSRVQGLYVGGVYLLGSGEKAVFGDGKLRPKLHLLERQADGKKKPVLLKEWAFSVEEAIPLRGKKPKGYGWGYGIPLVWGEQDLSGKELRLVVAFERKDGLTISSARRDVRVPVGFR